MKVILGICEFFQKTTVYVLVMAMTFCIIPIISTMVFNFEAAWMIYTAAILISVCIIWIALCFLSLPIENAVCDRMDKGSEEF